MNEPTLTERFDMLRVAQLPDDARRNEVKVNLDDLTALRAAIEAEATRTTDRSSEAVPAEDGLREREEATELLDAVADYLGAVKRTFVIFEPAEDRLRKAYNAVIQRANSRAALASTERAATPDGAGEDGLRGALERIVRINDRDFDAARDIARMAIDAADRATPARSDAGDGLDADRLYRAVIEELAILWGEPSDAISVQVRPILARQIADRYARLSEPPQ